MKWEELLPKNEEAHRSKRINKDIYCKKNKLGGGQYGPHRFERGRCIYCNKIDPRGKRHYYE